jgi:hypothetical protein
MVALQKLKHKHPAIRWCGIVMLASLLDRQDVPALINLLAAENNLENIITIHNSLKKITCNFFATLGENNLKEVFAYWQRWWQQHGMETTSAWRRCAVETAKRHLDSPDPQQRAGAVLVIGLTGTEEQLKLLLPLLKDPTSLKHRPAFVPELGPEPVSHGLRVCDYALEAYLRLTQPPTERARNSLYIDDLKLRDRMVEDAIDDIKYRLWLEGRQK